MAEESGHCQGSNLLPSLMNSNVKQFWQPLLNQAMDLNTKVLICYAASNT